MFTQHYLKLIRIPKIKKSFLFFSALYEEIDNMFVKPKLKVAAWSIKLTVINAGHVA